MTLEEQNKKLLELVKKYDKFAVELKNYYFFELGIGSKYKVGTFLASIIKETNDELKALREELRSLKSD